MTADIIAVIFSYLLHLLIRFKTGIFGSSLKLEVSLIISTGLIILVYWLMVFWFAGLYKDWYIRSPFDEIFTVIKAAFIGSFILFFFVLLDSSQAPRLLFLIYFIALSIFGAIGRYTIRKLQIKLKDKKIITSQALIIGPFDEAITLMDQVNKVPSWGFTVCGLLLFNDERSIDNNAPINVPVYNNIDNLTNALDDLNPSEVLITSSEKAFHKMLMEIVSQCAERKISVKIEPDLYDIFSGQARTLHLWGVPLIEVDTQIIKPFEAFIKRSIDIIFSAFVLLIGLPIWIIVAIIIKFESKGPVFYKQIRIGKKGKQFYIYKFRSMRTDAEKNGPQWAVVNDPRVTGFGRILRKYHIDEFPQFLNVLHGNMSLVGPRPERPFFVDKFSKIVPFYNRRHVIRPGITGWWQVKYTVYVETKEDIERRLKYDFYYIENMSLKLDIEIIIRTVFLVFKGHGQT
jgi:exopolysaccharide biosynthesis polyprenyl glycosylphosphotransferase